MIPLLLKALAAALVAWCIAAEIKHAPTIQD